MLAQAMSGLPPWRAHYDVWLFLLAILLIAGYVVRVMQPLAVAQGYPAISARQKAWFVLAFVFFFAVTDWPIHDIAEDYLYSIHMVQHLIYTLVIPPMVLLATPEWLARAFLGDGRLREAVRFMSRPIPAGVVYNLLVGITHAAFVVNGAVENPIVHLSVHTIIMVSAFLMWMPVISPIPEWRIGYLGRGLHLFLMSIIPTIPAAFLTTTQGILYHSYGGPVRLWGIPALADQQAAGLVMKIGGGLYIWTIILITFINGVQAERGQQNGRRGTFVPTVETRSEDVEVNQPV